MMIVAPSSWQYQNTSNFMPSRPSPLAPRSANVACRPAYMTSSNAQSDTPFAKRAYKPNPIAQSRDAVRERRRDLFLKKVQEKRDDRRWEGREDQIMRLDWFSRQKRWEAQLDRSAPRMDEPPEEEGDVVYEYEPIFSSHEDHCMSSSQRNSSQKSTFEEEVEAVAQQEDQELDALLAMMEEEENRMVAEDDASQVFGSDEEDYDRIFSELANGGQSDQQHQQHSFDDEMDMSNG